MVEVNKWNKIHQEYIDAQCKFTDFLEAYGLTCNLELGTDNRYYPSEGIREFTKKEMFEVLESRFDFSSSDEEQDIEDIPGDVYSKEIIEYMREELGYSIFDAIAIQLIGIEKYKQFNEDIKKNYIFLGLVDKILNEKKSMTEEELSETVTYWVPKAPDYFNGWVSSYITRS